jgi:ABC-type transporter Mla subunit MlaD
MKAEDRAWLLFALALTLGALAAGVGYLRLAARYATYEIDSREALSGLIPDSPVEFHGVEVGKVKRVELIDPYSVRILVSVSKDAPVSRATVATITQRGLSPRGFMGYVYVALEDVGMDYQPLTPAPGARFAFIPTTAARLASLDTTAGQVKQDMQSLTELVRYVLDRNTILALKESLDNLQKVSQTLATNNQKLGSMIVNGERASQRLEPLLKSSNEAVDTFQGQVLPQTHETLSRIQPLLESSNQAVSALQGQVLPQTYDALGELQALSASLKSLTSEVERDPSVLVRGQRSPPGPGEKR